MVQEAKHQYDAYETHVKSSLYLPASSTMLFLARDFRLSQAHSAVNLKFALLTRILSYLPVYDCNPSMSYVCHG